MWPATRHESDVLEGLQGEGQAIGRAMIVRPCLWEARRAAMASELSITRCIEALKGGDHDAARRIWEAYFHRLVGLARARLHDAPRRAADEEDVALSAFDSFCRGVDAGRFPRLDDRHDLWQVLVLITVRKAIDIRQHEGGQVRGGGKVKPLSDLADQGLDPTQAGEPGPEMAAQVV